MTKEEFMKAWGLEAEDNFLVDKNGEFVCDICPGCGKICPSSATLNCGTLQPEYCEC
jgi:hypothetical protein